MCAQYQNDPKHNVNRLKRNVNRVTSLNRVNRITRLNRERFIVYLFGLTLATILILLSYRLEAETIAQTVETQTVETQTVTQAIETKTVSANTRIQIYYLILAGEIAAKRQQKETALSAYREAAMLSSDPAVSEKATELSVQFEDPHLACANANRWAELDNDNLQAQLVATSLNLALSPEKAFHYLNRALEIDANYVIEHVAAMQQKLSEKSNMALHMALSDWAKQHPKNPFVLVLAAQSAIVLGDFSQGKLLVDAALQENDAFSKAIFLKAKLIRLEQNSEPKAVAFLHQKLETYPKNAELRLFYANVLYETNHTEDSILHLKKLIHDNDFASSSTLMLGEIYLRQKNYKDADTTLKAALSSSKTENEARFLLGQLAEIKGKKEEAIRYFSGVERGPFHVKAFMKAVVLLRQKQEYAIAMRLLRAGRPETWAEQKQLLLMEMDILSETARFEEALELSNEILAQIQNDTDVLYAKSILTIKLKQFKDAETTLTTLLSIDPNHPMALNAMGHMLTLQQERQKEAYPFLERGLKLAPNEPALLDSMGWLHYKLNNSSEAIKYLKKAHSLSDDSEIAAHFGAALWNVGQTDEALKIWKQALAKTPDHEILLKVMQEHKVIP